MTNNPQLLEIQASMIKPTWFQLWLGGICSLSHKSAGLKMLLAWSSDWVIIEQTQSDQQTRWQNLLPKLFNSIILIILREALVKDAFRPNSTVIQFVTQMQTKHYTRTGRILSFRRYHTSCRIWSVKNRMKQLWIRLICNNFLKECQIDKTDRISVKTNKIDFRTQY